MSTVLTKSVLFWRRAMYLDLLEGEELFYRMSRQSYHRARRRFLEHMQELRKEGL